MSELINSIREAEESAAAIKKEAVESAAQLIEAARAQAAKIEEDAAKERAAYRDERLAGAEEQAQKDYDAAMEKSKKEARAYADGIRIKRDLAAGNVVWRIRGGNS